GSAVIPWGGYSFEGSLVNPGRSYSPSTDIWKPLEVSMAPSGRVAHTGVWTGTEMLIWGGSNDQNVFNDGSRYNPSLKRWTQIGTAGSARARANHNAVWTGKEMLIWGGNDLHGNVLNDGGRYDP